MNSEINNKKLAQQMLDNMEGIDFPYARNRLYFHEWKPILKEIPSHTNDVLITDTHKISIGYFANGWIFNDNDYSGIITHWMELPEPPK